MILGDFESEYAQLVREQPPLELASRITAFAKTFDLTQPKHRSAAIAIAAQIDSEDERVRQAVMFALCGFQSTDEGRTILATAWTRAPDLDLHWYLAGIRGVCHRARDIPCELIVAVIRHALSCAEIASVPASAHWDDPTLQTLRVRSTRLAMRYLASVLRGDPDEADDYRNISEQTDPPIATQEVLQFVDCYLGWMMRRRLGTTATREI